MMSIKKGRFAMFNGEEYKVYTNEDHSLDLISHDANDVNNGFIEQYPDTYVKKVSKNEITGIHRIIPYAKYQGSRFDVNNQERNGEIHLGTIDATLAKDLGFERTDKYYYEKWVPKTEVEIFEERKEIKL
jgi:hypothetical protein